MFKDYPQEPTDIAKVNSEEYNSKLIGENERGTVHIHGPYGNKNSDIKIAYLIGMHPLESKSHRALFDTILSKEDNLNYKYYIYNINVKKELDKETEGRMDGQKLAKEFVVPDVTSKKYDFAIDIHGNKGKVVPGKYEESNFVFAPGFDEKSEKYMNILLDKIDEIVYYAPEYRTSPPYMTLPIVESGIPTIVYKTFSYEPMSKTYDLAEKLVNTVDNIKFE
ncbi:hypothetical protein BGI41_06905 [Methanobrevibacter sp. 87.7]|uniref:adhesin n=1 Tax=Methanobrevibacter sp. 87.7 TaxID=387957 RepID=UPI000B502F7E|nr:adhesin [Methanobrevibacter sp. 87.7]OWT32586.1 hypothetical protein BGI41_06905 [Methanobrevibacter sp. 87.7]